VKRSVWFALGLALAAPASVRAATPAFPPYPPNQSQAAIQGWIAAETDLQPSQVVIIAGGAVYAMPASPDNHDDGGVSTRMVREEVVDAALAARLGGRSSTAMVSFDCAHKQYAIRSAVVFPGNNLSGGAARPILGGAWLSAATVYLFDLAGAVCAADQPAAAAPAPQTTPEPTPQPVPAPPPSQAPAVPAPAPTPPEPTPAASAPAAPEPTSGPAWVQAGAFASPKLAEARWNAVRGHLPIGASHRLEPAPNGALTRLLIGPFPSDAEAAEACRRLKGAGVACFVRR